MDILAIADLHGDLRRLEDLRSRIQQCEVVLFAGDLTDFGGEKEIGRIIEFFSGAEDRLITVPGNCDCRAARDALSARKLNADGLLLERYGVLVAGSGGAMIRTGLTPYERPDEDLGSSLELALSGANRMTRQGRPLAILTHHPPRHSGADRRRESSVGSPSFREELETSSAPLWVCGHIHESRSAEYLGDTLVVNPGPLMEGCYAMIHLENYGSGSWRAEARLFP